MGRDAKPTQRLPAAARDVPEADFWLFYSADFVEGAGRDEEPEESPKKRFAA